jgi:ATP-dependent 26S proteasome regulatory subunit
MSADMQFRPYRDGFEHLEEELQRLDLLLRLKIGSQSLLNGVLPERQASRAVCISSGEVEWLLNNGHESRPEETRNVVLRAELAKLKAKIDGRIGRSKEEKIFLALPHLCDLFGLSSFERDAVMICLAPELRRKYDRLYAYLQDDITRKRPSVDLVLDLLCDSEAKRWNGRRFFADSATLLRSGLLQKVDDPASPSGSSGLSQFLKLDDRICEFLLDNNQMDARLAGDVQILQPTRRTDSPTIEHSIVAGASMFVERQLSSDNPDRRKLILHVHGPRGVGKRELALHIAGRLNCALLNVDAELLLARGENAERFLRIAFREALLQRAAIFVEHADALSQESAKTLFKCFLLAISEFGWLVFLSSVGPWNQHQEFANCVFHSIQLPAPDALTQEAAWMAALDGEIAEAEIWSKQLASQFRLTPGQIRAAAELAKNRRYMNKEKGAIVFEELTAACRQQSSQKLSELAVKIVPHCDWNDLVLPSEKITHLREISIQFRNRHKVFETWGFGKKLGRGKGLSVLFAGPSGTGKTMAAGVLARDLGLDLYKVDLANVVSKYIGETEKNLSRIFAEAEASNVILLFDEADALFGKRTEVSDAHDRYANIETSYLLQKMEAYEGVVIMATNLRENIDEAFTRRIQFIVEFPFPDEANSLRIWKGHFPQSAPVSPELDFTHFAKELRLAGGNIKNIVLNAAFLAAENGDSVGKEHILNGSRREYEKMGKIWRQPSFAVGSRV